MVLPKSRNDSRRSAHRRFLIQRLTTIASCLLLFSCGYFMISDIIDYYSNNNEPILSSGQQPTDDITKNHGTPNNDSNDRGRRNTMKPILVDLQDKSPSSPLQELLAANVHLIDILPRRRIRRGSYEKETYSDIDAIFCELDFSKQRKDPTSVPMFRHLVSHSPKCRSGPQYKVDLKGFTDLARDHDAKVKQGDLPKSLNLTGFVFHESRCGSTLVANALVAMNPSEHRVFSESSPPIVAMRDVCGENQQYCSVSQAADVLKDVIYLMGRSNDPQEKRVFFKIQSIASLNIKIFQHAYPNIPWVYVYRDPIQVMMSQLQNGVRNANCVQGRRRGGQILSQYVKEQTSFSSIDDLTDVQYCAAHLATLTQSAVDSMEQSNTASFNLMGRAINYEQLPDVLWNSVLPDHFGIGPLSEDTIKLIKDVSGIYSKSIHGRHKEFKGDSEKKERKATQEVRDATKTFLQESYDRLLTYNF